MRSVLAARYGIPERECHKKKSDHFHNGNKDEKCSSDRRIFYPDGGKVCDKLPKPIFSHPKKGRFANELVYDIEQPE